MSCVNHHSNQVLEHFQYLPQIPSILFSLNPLIHPQPQLTSGLIFESTDLTFLEFHIGGINIYVVFSIWLLLLSVFLKFIHVVALSVLHSFLLLSNISLGGIIQHIFIHTPTSSWSYHLILRAFKLVDYTNILLTFLLRLLLLSCIVLINNFIYIILFICLFVCLPCACVCV